MDEPVKLAPQRKRPRRVARKIRERFAIAHYRDVPRGWHCPDCLPVFDLDDDQGEILDRCMLYGGIRIAISVSGLAALDESIADLENEQMSIHARLDAVDAERSANMATLRAALNDACTSGRIGHDACLAALTTLDG